MVLKRSAKDAHSREKKMSLTRPRSAREFRKRNSLFLYRTNSILLQKYGKKIMIFFEVHHSFFTIYQ